VARWPAVRLVFCLWWPAGRWCHRGRHRLPVGIHQPGPVRARLPGPIWRKPVDDPPPAHAGAAAGQLARGLANARRVTAKVPCRGAAQATVTRPCPPALVAGALGSW